MRIGNQDLLDRRVAAFVGPRNGVDEDDKRRFRNSINEWLESGGVVMTGGAIGSDFIAMNAVIDWAEDHNVEELPLIVVLPRTEHPMRLSDSGDRVYNTTPASNHGAFDHVASHGGLLIQRNKGAMVPDRLAYIERDELMVRLSEELFVSAYLNARSGTGATIRRARAKGINVTICGRSLVD